MTIQGSYTQLVDYVRRRARDIAYQEPSLEPGIAKFRELVLAEVAEDFFSKQNQSLSGNKSIDIAQNGAQTETVGLGVVVEPRLAGVASGGTFNQRNTMTVAEMKSEWASFMAKFPTSADAAQSVANFFQHYETQQQLDAQAIAHLQARGAASGYTLVPVPPTV